MAATHHMLEDVVKNMVTKRDLDDVKSSIVASFKECLALVCNKYDKKLEEADKTISELQAKLVTQSDAASVSSSGAAITSVDDASAPATKRARVAFSMAPVSSGTQACKPRQPLTIGRRTGASKPAALALFAEAAEAEAEAEAKAEADAPTVLQAILLQPAAAAAVTRLATSSEIFEQYRSSLRAKNAPLFAQYKALISSERGFSGCADRDVASLGLAELGGIIEDLVQLADLRTEQQQQQQQHKWACCFV